MPSTVLTAPSPIDATSAQQLGEAVFVGTATTQSGRKVTIEQYNSATKAGKGLPSRAPATWSPSQPTDQQEQQRYMLNGNTIY